MPVVRLMGGLGNQMFQYAFGRRIAEELGRQVKFDLVNGFKHDLYCRRFALGVFNTEIVGAEANAIPLGMSWRSPWHRVAKAGWSAMPAVWRRVVYEKTAFQFDEAKLPTPGRSRGSEAHYSTQSETPHIASYSCERSAYYFGYWQHESYFAPFQDKLRREFTLRVPLPEPLVAMQEAMAGCRAVSVHVRQYHDMDVSGKVIHNAQANHGACSVDFYHLAAERVGTGPGTVYFVFSDNVPWAKANLKLPGKCRFVADLCPCSDAEEMLLMASCQHHIISNSSFSWWGAWLGGNPKRVVVAPQAWTRRLPPSAVDICPRAWVKL